MREMDGNGRRGRGWRRRLGIVGIVAAVSAAAVAMPWRRSADASEVDWRAVSAVGFPEHVRTLLDAGCDAAEVTEWTAELDASPETASRAAVLLGGLIADERADPLVRDAAARALITRLSERKAAGSRSAVGVDVVAARALDERAKLDPGVARVLASLAVGMEPHPDLPVRVECAASAVEAGQRGGLVEFLIAVLRAETPDQVQSPRSWERVTTLAWVKTRAALALSRVAGVEMRFRPDGSWAAQMAEAQRLERLIGGG